MKGTKHIIFRYAAAIVLLAFAAVTLFMSSSVIFDWFGIREKEGNYVPFIVFVNFIAGFFYLMAVIGFLKSKKWTFWILMGTSTILFFALMALLAHISRGGDYEIKTVGAMGFRIIVTILFTLIAFYKIQKQHK